MTALARPERGVGPSYTPAAMLAELQRLDCEDSLLEFVKRMWPVIEPATQLKFGKPLEAICLHLEAVSDGRINRLLINVPPGSMKSLLVDVFWPAWEWTKRPWLRYVSFSYAANLTETNNSKFLMLISSPEYQEFWGERGRGEAQFGLKRQGQTEVSNTSTGSKFATSVGGVGTGKRGDRVICFPYGELVQTEDGPQPIGHLVESRYCGRVWAFDRQRGRFELKPILRWLTNPGDHLVRLRFADGGSLVCTVDHKVMTDAGEWVPAGSRRSGDRLLAAPRGMLCTTAPIAVPKWQIEVSPNAAASDASDGQRTHAELGCKNRSGVIVPGSDLTDHLLGEVAGPVAEVTVPLAVGEVLGSRAVFEVGQDGVSPVVVLVPDLLPCRAGAEKRRGDHLVHEAVQRFTTDAQRHARVTLVQDRGEDLPEIDPPFVVSPWKAAHSSEPRDSIEAFGADDVAPVVAHVESVELIHDVPAATYCLTVENHHTLLCGTGHNIICSNCDDPHNVKEAESDAVRTTTVEWFANAMSNRLNDLQVSAIVIIMQRVHQGDVSGFVLDKPLLGYTHLMIPAEYEEGREGYNAIGWRDWRTEEGESFWPERYPIEALDGIKATQTPFAYAGQYQQRPEPKGGGILKREWWGSYVGKTADGTRLPYPAFDYVVAAIDTAFGEKQTNDFSAMTVWGIYQDGAGLSRGETPVPRVLLLYAWQKRLAIHDLVRETADTMRKLRPDRLLIEAKASGISLRQELRRLYAGEDWGVTMVDPGRQDKVARVHAIAHVFHEGIVQVPVVLDEHGGETPFAWAQTVIDQAALFPKASHDDLVDTGSMALKHLRDLGLLTKADERRREDLAALDEPVSQTKLYPA